MISIASVKTSEAIKTTEYFVSEISYLIYLLQCGHCEALDDETISHLFLLFGRPFIKLLINIFS